MVDRLIWTECPRDAMQGFVRVFPTEAKVAYLRSLLSVGFDVIDIGSFVSPKAIPQMADTAEVLNQLMPEKGDNRFLVICANARGVESAIDHQATDIIGFPFSLSEEFQQRNTKRSRAQALEELKAHADNIHNAGKELVVYLSMAFGNPYDEPWNQEEISELVQAIQDHCQPMSIALSDTVAKATPSRVRQAISAAHAGAPDANIAMHMHVSGRDPMGAGVIQAGWEAGVRRFDSAILGFGGCPMAQDSLCGNLPTEALLSYCGKEGIAHELNPMALEAAHNQARKLFEYL